MMRRNNTRTRVFLALALPLLLAAAPPVAHAESRTWTSASDPTRQFEGQLVAASDDKVTVRRADGQDVTFSLDVLSEQDRAYVEDHRGDLPAPAENKVYQELSSNMARGTVSAGAEYYILYAAASF